MTVKRLKEILAEYDDDMPIKVMTYRSIGIHYTDYRPDEVEIEDISSCNGELEILVG